MAYEYNPTGTISHICFNETAPDIFMEDYEYQYQIRDWVEQIGESGNQSKPFFASYQHDHGGNILTASYFNRQSSLDNEYKYDFGYDNLYRLKYADYSYYSRGWNNHSRFDLSSVNYDPNGNLLHLERAKEDGTFIDDINYLYSGNNRLNGIVDAVSQSGESWDAEDCNYQYDANGNLTRIVSGGTLIIDTIEYNHLNLPVHIINGDGSEIFYRYNKDGQRIYKEVDENMSEYYIIDEAKTAAIASLGEGIKYWNIFALELAGKMMNTGDKYYYIKDHLGSIRAILNDANQVVESHDYYPFGLDMPSRSYISPQITERNKELFTGKERDSETGWDYFGARYYDPAIGRWLSVDPLAEETFDVTPYHYTHNNPLNRSDQNGESDHFIRVLKSSIAKEYPNTYRNVETGEIQKEITQGAIILADNMSTSLTVAGSIPTPASAFFLGSSTVFKTLAISGKLKQSNGEITQDIIGDVAGQIVGTKVPLTGQIVDMIIDNFETTTQRVDMNKKIHVGPTSAEKITEINNENCLNLKPIPAHSEKDELDE
jgi:RHS repeat-associated protein